MKIEVSTNPTAIELETLSEGIQSFNDKMIGPDAAREKDHRFIVIAKSVSNELLGGIRANAYWNYMDIELFWLNEDTRGQGIGTAILKRAEKYAKDLGYEFAKLTTTSFQAEVSTERMDILLSVF